MHAAAALPERRRDTRQSAALPRRLAAFAAATPGYAASHFRAERHDAADAILPLRFH